MPKEAVPKFGDPLFDHKQTISEFFEPGAEKLKEEIDECKFLLKLGKLKELMEFFKIDPKSEDAWMWLAFELAERYVPAMQFAEKPGAPPKWTNRVCWGLHALYETTKTSQPSKTTKKAIFYSMPEGIADTWLEKRIGENIKGERLREEYDNYTKTYDFQLRVDVLDATFTEEEKVQYFQEYLRKQPSALLREFISRLSESISKDAVFTFMTGGAPSPDQARFSYLTKVAQYSPKAVRLLRRRTRDAKKG